MQILSDITPKIPSKYERYIEPFFVVERCSLPFVQSMELLLTTIPI